MPSGVDPKRPTKATVFGGAKDDKYPLNNKIDKGYGVNLPTRYPTGYNAVFINQKDEELPLYVTDIEFSIEMGGEIAQSKNVRQFFSANLVQPSIQISGITPSSYHYNNLASFVRRSHDLAIFGNQEGSDKLTGFKLLKGSFYEKGKSFADSFPYDGNRESGKQITKGNHEPIEVYGYIQGASAGGRKENHAPEWQITMMIAEMRQGPWKDEAVPVPNIGSWMDVFYGLTNKQKSKMFVQQETRKTPAKKPSETDSDPITLRRPTEGAYANYFDNEQ